MDSYENGVDVSQYQGSINWRTLAAQAQFAWIRASDGTLPDTRIDANWSASRGLLPRGPYLAFYPQINPLLQARALFARLGDDYGELPPAVDVESPKQAWSATWRESLQTCLAEVERIAGRKPVVYTGAWYMPYVGNAPWLSEYLLWLGEYVPAASLVIPKPWATYTIWQHSSSGDGQRYGAASTYIDLDVLSVPLSTLFKRETMTNVQITSGDGKVTSLPLPLTIQGDLAGLRITGSSQPYVDVPAPLTVAEIAPDPIIEFSADATSIAAGVAVTLSMHFEHVDGAWLVYDGVDHPLDGSVQPVVVKLTPQASTTYALKCLVAGEYVAKEIAITVAPAVAEGDWAAQFWANESLQGDPIVSKTYAGPDLSMQLGTGSPDSLVPSDHFSARFTQVATLPAAAYQWSIGADDGVRFYVDGEMALDKWVPQVATYVVTRTLAAGRHTFVAEYYEDAGAANFSITRRTTINLTTMRVIGAHTLHSTGEPLRSRLNGGKTMFTCMNADEAARLARDGHDVWQRTWKENSDWSPSQIVALQQALPDDVKANVGLIVNNEGDWGFGRRGDETAYAWLKRIAQKYIDTMKIAYAAGYRRFAICCMPMGCPDVTDEEVRKGLRDFFKGLYNYQTIEGTKDGTRAEIRFDWHNYVPTPNWLYPDMTVPAVAASALGAKASATSDVPALVMYPGPVKVVRAKAGRDEHEVTWMVPDTSKALASALPSTTRTIRPCDWFLTRYLFCFWPEMGIELDPNVSEIFSSETGCDEGGKGGMVAQALGPAGCQRWVIRALDLVCEPLVIDGVSYPTPYLGGTIFTLAMDDPQWTPGYGIGEYLASPEVDVTKWSRKV
jgi:GH25 family lysozyme M1 (1,4-beta-N-acetylmuramidase)